MALTISVGLLLFLTRLSIQMPDNKENTYVPTLSPWMEVPKRQLYFPKDVKYGDDSEEQRLKNALNQQNPFVQKLLKMAKDPIPYSVRKKREVDSSEKDSTLDFIEDKLIEHGQALEQLLKMVHDNEKLTKQLVESLNKRIEQPKLPETVHVQKPTRRYSKTTTDVVEANDNPLVRIGKNLPKYGSLLKNLIANEIHDVKDAAPLVEVVEKSQEKGNKTKVT